MKTSFRPAAFAAMIVLLTGLPGCEKFDDSDILDSLEKLERKVEDHERRLSELEEICKRINSDIVALQKLLETVQGRLTITDCMPVTDGEKVLGYCIKFSDDSSITLFNGKDGEDATIPVIGAREDENGIICWTVDGEWLTGADGKHIPCTGKDGENGQNGITPLLRISEDGFWEISYDSGKTYVRLGKATGGEAGDSSAGLFKDVTAYSDQDGTVWLVIVLSDGSKYSIRTGNPDEGTSEEDFTMVNRDIESLAEVAMALRSRKTIVSFHRKNDGSGCTVRLSDGSDVSFFCDCSGKDGSGIRDIGIGIRSIDGVLCWAVSGDPVQDSEGCPVPLAGGEDGNASYPRFRSREGAIQYSTDGNNYKTIDYRTDIRIQFIKSVLLAEDSGRLTFVLYDGSTYSVNAGKFSSEMISAGRQLMTVTAGRASFDMVHVEHGTFIMGDGYSAGIWDASSPFQKVTISKDLWVARHKVQAALAETIYDEPPSWAVESARTGSLVVTLPEGWDFIDKLSEITGITFDVPTSAQWEWFATGGNKSEGHIYWGRDTLPSSEEEKRGMLNELGISFEGLELVKDGFFRFGYFGTDPMLDDDYGYIDPFHECNYQNGIVVRGTDIIRRRTYFSDYRGTFRLVSEDAS